MLPVVSRALVWDVEPLFCSPYWVHHGSHRIVPSAQVIPDLPRRPPTVAALPSSPIVCHPSCHRIKIWSKVRSKCNKKSVHELASITFRPLRARVHGVQPAGAEATHPQFLRVASEISQPPFLQPPFFCCSTCALICTCISTAHLHDHST